MDELILPTLWLLLVAPQLLLSMCVCVCARARGCFPWCVRRSGKIFSSFRERREETRAVSGTESRFLLQRTLAAYQKGDKSPQGRSRSATGGGWLSFFRATSRRAPLASLPPFPLLAPLALNPCFCSFLLASGVHKLVLSLALSTHSAVKKGGTMTKRIGERGGYCRFPKTFGSNEPRVS